MRLPRCSHGCNHPPPEGDTEAKRLELADQALPLAVAVALREVVAAQILVVALVVSRCQTITRIEWPTATAARFLPRRRASRQNWAAR